MASQPQSGSAPRSVSPQYRGYVLAMLVIVYTFNFLDRQIIGILAVPIKEELGLTDSQLGLMGGIAFAVLYSTLGLPIAWLADRFNRVWIMTGALTAWSAMTAICGLAGNFWQLFLARVGVGVGEAGGVTPAYTLIADYFPPNQRARALAIYSFGIPIGSAAGIVFGGVIASAIDWRTAFLVVGAAGLVFAPLFLLTVKEPRPARAKTPTPPDPTLGRRVALGAGLGVAIGAGASGVLALGLALSSGEAAGVVRAAPAIGLSAMVCAFVGANLAFFWDVTRVLLTKWRSFFLLSVGAAASSMMGYGLFFWVPGFAIRSYGEDLRDVFAWAPSWLVPEGAGLVLLAGYFFGAIVLVGGIAGIALGGVLGDWLGSKRRANYARVPAMLFIITAPLFALAVLSPNPAVAFFLFIPPVALSLSWLGPILTAFQHLVAASMRATASSVFLLINNLLGIGGGIYALGALSDAFASRFGDDSLRYSILTGSSLYVVAAVLFLLASFRLDQDWVGDHA